MRAILPRSSSPGQLSPLLHGPLCNVLSPAAGTGMSLCEGLAITAVHWRILTLEANLSLLPRS